jgi:uncharacterized membrane protein/thiol-disulfide isomerase/thioredoxin
MAVERYIMKQVFCITNFSLAMFIVLFMLISPAQAEVPVVHAILFYSPSCPHCHKVIAEDLPPLLKKYPDQLFIVGIDTYTEQGHELYETIVNTYQIPPERLGVPTIIVGETVLVGSLEIPEQFPGIIEDGLTAGGISWPDIPEVQKLLLNEGFSDFDGSTEDEEPGDMVRDEPINEDGDIDDVDDMVQKESVDERATDDIDDKDRNAYADDQSEAAEVHEEALLPEDTHSEDESLGISTSLEEAVFTTDHLTLTERFARDKTGNTVSVIVLLGMIFSVVGVGASVFRSPINPKPWPNWMVPTLVLIGMGVAIYMGYVEITRSEAVCGPVGDCNTVQQSPYASLFGIIPIGVLGIGGYLLIGITWLFAVNGPAKWKNISAIGLWLLSLFGALFSIYLTFLEPFVIGATCAWCLTSAIVMHLLLWATTAPAMTVWKEAKIHTIKQIKSKNEF